LSGVVVFPDLLDIVIRKPLVAVGNRTPSAELVVTVVTTAYDLVRAVAVPCVVPAAATSSGVSLYNVPTVNVDVDAIDPGAINVVGVDIVTAPVDALTLT
jgi:hypothetical protein